MEMGKALRPRLARRRVILTDTQIRLMRAAEDAAESGDLITALLLLDAATKGKRDECE